MSKNIKILFTKNMKKTVSKDTVCELCTLKTEQCKEEPIKRTSPRPISTAKLKTSLCVHLKPINLVVFKGSYQLSLWEI